MSILTKISNALKGVFLINAEIINEQAKVVKRRRKFTPASLAQTFILAFLNNPKASCENIACMAVASGVEISAQAIEQRYSPELVLFFKLLFQDMAKIAIASDETLAPILERFSEVIMIDSSSIRLPDSEAPNYQGCGGSHGSGKAALKLQTELDLRSGRLRCVEIEPGRSPDGASSRQDIEQTPNSLRIADLGYFNIPVLKRIEESDAYFLTRVQHHVKIHVDGVKHDLVRWLNSQEKGVVDHRIELGSHERFSCRLIAYRVPEETANRRRQKLISTTVAKSRRQPSAASLAACDWEFMVTNLDEEQLSVEEAIATICRNIMFTHRCSAKNHDFQGCRYPQSSSIQLVSKKRNAGYTQIIRDVNSITLPAPVGANPRGREADWISLPDRRLDSANRLKDNITHIVHRRLPQSGFATRTRPAKVSVCSACRFRNG